MKFKRTFEILAILLFIVIVKNGSSFKVNKSSSCGQREMHVQCHHCGPKTCEELGYPKPCKGVMSLCRSQCVCIDGYVRDAERKCILKKDCPSCGGDKNATSGCGNHCGNRCSDYKDSNKTCLTGCRYNNCDCRTGYVFHEQLGVCVHPNDCSRSVKCLGSSAFMITMLYISMPTTYLLADTSQ